MPPPKLVRARCPESLKPGDRAVLASVLRSGGLVVYPTDTVYGLGCDPRDEEAVRRLLEAKRRPPGKPLPVLVPSLARAAEIGVLDRRALRLAAAFWPGPLTVIVKAKARLAAGVEGPGGTVGLRAPACRVAVELAEAAGGAIVGTSANVSGRPAPRSLADALSQLESIDAAVDGGELPGTPSTVVDLTGPEPLVVREGSLPARLVLEALREA